MRDINLRGEIFHIHDDHDAISNAIERDKDFYENHILDYIQRLAPDQKIIVDAGANIGNHSIYFARFFNHSKIIAFEPMPENLELLQKNTKNYPTIEVYNVALSNTISRAVMQRFRFSPGLSQIRHMLSDIDTFDPTEDDEPNRLEEVNCITLDSLNLTDVTLLKIDVEDHEKQVIEGASKTIEHNKPILLIEDYSDTSFSLPQLEGYTKINRWESSWTSLYIYDK